MIYAVKEGRVPGIYDTYEEMYKNVIGFPCALFKTFANKEDADLYMEEEITTRTLSDKISADISHLPVSYVDGSFNEETNTYGYGGILFDGNVDHILQGSGTDKDMARMRNVAGEIEGAKAGILKAKELGLPQLVIAFDYAGIGYWASGRWRRNKDSTKAYYQFVKDAAMDMEIFFRKVKSHSGIQGNEIADTLAKEAVGIK